MQESIAERLQQVYRDVLPWANAGRGLPPDLEADPNYAAAYALWRVVLAEKSPASARLSAIKEYHDRVYGKVSATEEATNDETKTALNLDCLSDSERSVFLSLLDKIQGKPAAIADKNGGDDEQG